MLLAEYGGNLALHEGPGYIGPYQWTPLSAGTINLGPLAPDTLPCTGKTELVTGDRWTLNKVGIFKPLLAQTAFQGAVVTALVVVVVAGAVVFAGRLRWRVVVVGAGADVGCAGADVIRGWDGVDDRWGRGGCGGECCQGD
ncbi:hypothetical protein JTE90_006352 [Oedothorax gibbosus]|uniref:Uncharacterized protein n=1 Tax=Oedothorax gibbosus TaxID=931172 RepID=A0AAV6VYI2_9ARAC|nr:hypothetical protein JTE90_006352 [Oedothorax gibbosus]